MNIFFYISILIALIIVFVLISPLFSFIGSIAYKIKELVVKNILK